MSGNQVVSNGGDGLYTTACSRVVFRDNRCQSNTGYGIQIVENWDSNIFGVNPMSANTAGRYNVSNTIMAVAVPITDPSNASIVMTALSNSYQTQSLASLGDYATGTLSLLMNRSATTLRNSLYTIVWDGTTLTATSLKQIVAGGTTTITAPNMSGNNIQTAYTETVADNTTASLNWQFNGVVYRHN